MVSYFNGMNEFICMCVHCLKCSCIGMLSYDVGYGSFIDCYVLFYLQNTTAIKKF